MKESVIDLLNEIANAAAFSDVIPDCMAARVKQEIEDAHIDGAVEALKVYADALDSVPNTPITTRGVSAALKRSAMRIKRNHEDGKLIADLDPDRPTT